MTYLQYDYGFFNVSIWLAQSVGAAKDTNCVSAEEQDSPYECPRYDTKQSDGEASVMLVLLGMRSIYSLPLLPGPL